MNLNTLLSRVTGFFQYGRRIRPVRDWFAILSVAAVLFIASVAWNAWVFYDVTHEEAVDEQTNGTGAPGLKSLTEARAVLSARAEEAEKYKTFYEFVDPSR